MLFNSVSYLIFLPIVFFIYWIIGEKNNRNQNVLLLLASYIFYSFWDYRFSFLLLFSTLLCYWFGLWINQSEAQSRRKLLLVVSVTLNVGILVFVKYYNFFVVSFSELLHTIGLKGDIATLNIILPIGISFYTFHGLSYLFDIYNRRIEPTRNVVDYALFVSFFPLLVAGPIERASHLLPQIEKKREFNYTKSIDGLKQILWGLFKKIVIADNCAVDVNHIFNNYQNYPASTLFLGAVFFAIQIYCDFSGYSDIAIGTARLFGFDLLRNFAFPYFSRDIAEFWRRWHMSLTTWFRDYLYIPLGGSRGSKYRTVRNTFIIFLVSGFWHGANWTFIGWGLLHALFFMPLLLLKTNRSNVDVVADGRLFPTLEEFFKMTGTFLLVVFTWILFRSETIKDALSYTRRIFSKSLIDKPVEITKSLLPFIAILFVFEWINRKEQHGLAFPNIHRRLITWPIYFMLLLLIIWNGAAQQSFIYFQF